MAIMLLYFKAADYFNIIDKPNQRSSHTEITLRGGGIIFWFAALLYFVQNPEHNYFFFTGITLVSLVSFWDDIQSLSNKIRISIHFISITLIFYDLGLFNLTPVWSVVIAYILAIGLINAYNFMDGINGITGLYTLVVLGSLFYVNSKIQLFIDSSFVKYGMIASLVFLFFNYRKKAKCFAGDVGSIAIAFWIIYLVLKLILNTSSFIWLLFLAVYGVDAVCTIIHRLYLKQNIFEAHRLHLYQVLSNECKIQHRIVSLYYALVQAVISLLVIFLYQKVDDLILFLIVILPLLLIYSSKFYLLKKNEIKYMIPKVIQGGNFSDHRGIISYVNDFSFKDIERFYIISNSDENPIRAWQGHKLDSKNFYCVSGSFKIHFVKIDNWENPSKNLPIETIIVSEFDSKIVHIPIGYANAIQSLETNSKLISFSTLPLINVKEDDARYPSDYWNLNG